MRKILAVLITAFSLLLVGPASANTIFNGQSIDSLKTKLICADDGDKNKKKKGDEESEDEEPECD